jgi:hypothetical protein
MEAHASVAKTAMPSCSWRRLFCMGSDQIERCGHGRQDREWRISTTAGFYQDLDMVVGRRIGSLVKGPPDLSFDPT